MVQEDKVEEVLDQGCLAEKSKRPGPGSKKMEVRTVKIGLTDEGS